MLGKEFSDLTQKHDLEKKKKKKIKMENFGFVEDTVKGIVCNKGLNI